MGLFKKVKKYGFLENVIADNYSYLSSEAQQDLVFAGDSITYLFPIDELIDYPARNRGISGDTSECLLNRWDRNVLALDPKLIVLLVGVNDFSYDREISDIVNDIFSCINRSIQYNKDIKFILEAVYPTYKWGKNRNKLIKELNSILEEEAKKYDCITFVNLYNDLALEDGNANMKYFYDGLHPNAQGFELIANKLNPIIKELLK